MIISNIQSIKFLQIKTSNGKLIVRQNGQVLAQFLCGDHFLDVSCSAEQAELLNKGTFYFLTLIVKKSFIYNNGRLNPNGLEFELNSFVADFKKYDHDKITWKSVTPISFEDDFVKKIDGTILGDGSLWRRLNVDDISIFTFRNIGKKALGQTGNFVFEISFKNTFSLDLILLGNYDEINEKEDKPVKSIKDQLSELKEKNHQNDNFNSDFSFNNDDYDFISDKDLPF